MSHPPEKGYGVAIDGEFFQDDHQTLDHDTFLNKLIEFLEANGCSFLGMTKTIDQEGEPVFTGNREDLAVVADAWKGVAKELEEQENTLTMEQLEAMLEPLAQYKLVTQVVPREPKGFYIYVVDEDIFQYETDDGEMDTMDASIRPATLILNEEGVVGAIEHSFGLFTRVNKREIGLLTNLIDKRIIIENTQ